MNSGSDGFDGGFLSVAGWSGAAVSCGLKPSGNHDLALLRADEPCAAAAVWTRNELPAAPVVVSREALARERRVRSIVINAGNANALTGRQGLADAREMQRITQELCGGPALVFSTGIIGEPLPMERVRRGIAQAAEDLAPTCPEVADAILTTDSVRKTRALRCSLPASGDAPSRTAVIGGTAKGSGMIHPNMATMLAFVAVDQAIDADALDAILRRAVDASFHEISVDGDTSTNDAVLLVSGAAGGPPIRIGDARLGAVERGITSVMEQLALAIVEDGEGRTRVLRLSVTGAADDAAARRIADSVVRSPLVKTALAGGDPNWGRVLAAAANAGVPLETDGLALRIGGIRVFAAGEVEPGHDREALERAVAGSHVSFDLELNAGEGRARKWTTDLSTEYVRINSEYTT